MPFDKKEVSGRGTIFLLLFVGSVAFVLFTGIHCLFKLGIRVKAGVQGGGSFFLVCSGVILFLSCCVRGEKCVLWVSTPLLPGRCWVEVCFSEGSFFVLAVSIEWSYGSYSYSSSSTEVYFTVSRIMGSFPLMGSTVS